MWQSTHRWMTTVIFCLAGSASTAQDNFFVAPSVHDISREQLSAAIDGVGSVFECEPPEGANDFLYFQSAQNEYVLSFFSTSGQAVRIDRSSQIILRRMEGDHWMLICQRPGGFTSSIPIPPGTIACFSLSGRFTTMIQASRCPEGFERRD